MTNLSLHSIVTEASTYLVKNSTSILTGCGLAGIVATAVSAARGTIRAKEVIDNASKETEAPIDTKEKVKLAWKSYIPTAAIGATTAACFIGAQSINVRRNMALATLYAMTNDEFRNYRNAVTEQIGERKEERVKDCISQHAIEDNPVSGNEVIVTDGTTLCYDPWSGRYFRGSIERIRGAVNDINAEVNRELTATLNDFYYLIGLSEVKLGDKICWTPDHPMSIYFSSQIAENDEPCIVMNYYGELNESR